MIRGRVVQAQVKASSALRALTHSNADAQRTFMELDAPKVLIKLYIKVSEHNFPHILAGCKSDLLVLIPWERFWPGRGESYIATAQKCRMLTSH